MGPFKRLRGGDDDIDRRAKRFVIVMRDILDRPGNDLLSRVLRHSTISAEEFNGRVRDGIGFWLLAQATGPAKDMASIRSLMIVSRLVSRTLIMRTIKPIEQLVPVS